MLHVEIINNREIKSLESKKVCPVNVFVLIEQNTSAVAQLLRGARRRLAAAGLSLASSPCAVCSGEELAGFSARLAC